MFGIVLATMISFGSMNGIWAVPHGNMDGNKVLSALALEENGDRLVGIFGIETKVQEPVVFKMTGTIKRGKIIEIKLSSEVYRFDKKCAGGIVIVALGALDGDYFKSKGVVSYIKSCSKQKPTVKEYKIGDWKYLEKLPEKKTSI